MDLVLLAVWCFLVALGGGLVGLVLGNLRLPVVLLVASSPAAGAGANIAISAVAAGTAAVAHIRAPAAVVSGAAIGFLGGVVGLILGSLRMPALLRLVGEAPVRAVGTNVAVGFFVGIAGALGHLPNAAPDLTPILVGGAASIPGALLGSRLTGRLSERELIRAIGVVLLIAAASMVVEAIAR